MIARRDHVRPPAIRSAAASREAGFTLIEIVVAMFVMSIALLGLASIMAGTSRRHERSVSHAELTSAAESKLEELRGAAASAGPDTVQLAGGGSLDENVAGHADSLPTEYGRSIRRRWVVDDGPAGTRAVTLRVVPDGGRRNDHPGLVFRTLIRSNP